MSDTYSSNLQNADNTLTIDISRFLEILELTSSTISHEQGPQKQGSIFGGTLSHDAATTRPASLTQLERLPAITMIDSTAATTSQSNKDYEHTGALPARNPPDTSVPAINNTSHLSGNDMLLSTDQFFGSQLPDINAWWNGAWGDIAGSMNSNGI